MDACLSDLAFSWHNIDNPLWAKQSQTQIQMYISASKGIHSDNCRVNLEQEPLIAANQKGKAKARSNELIEVCKYRNSVHGQNRGGVQGAVSLYVYIWAALGDRITNKLNLSAHALLKTSAQEDLRSADDKHLSRKLSYLLSGM